MGSARRPAAPVLPSILDGMATDNVITGAELEAAGVSRSTIASRCKAGGPWRRVLPGVVLLDHREPTRKQLLRAAVYQLGEHAVITGADALRAHGAPVRVPKPVHVLIPTTRRTSSTEYTTPERTTRLPSATVLHGLPFAAPHRAAIDAARRENEFGTLRDLLRVPQAYALCTPEQLWQELDAGNQRGTADIRDALRSPAGRDSGAFLGLARRLIAHSPLPPPAWQVTVYDKRDRRIGPVDAWWDALAVGWQFSPALSAPGTLTHLNLTATGVVLVRTSPERLRSDYAAVLTELASGLRTAARRTRPPVRGIPSHNGDSCDI